MRLLIIRFISFFILLLVLSCIDRYEFPAFSENQNKLVIEAIVTNESSIQQVKISRTILQTDTTVFQGVQNAIVTLSDDFDQSQILQEAEPGVYYSSNFNTTIGNRYHLEVIVNDTVYSASETMYPSAKFDSVNIIYFENHLFLEDGYYIQIYSQKSSDITSYYKATISKNDSLYNSYNDLLIFDDSFISDYMELLVPYPFEMHDTVNLKSFTLSESLYNYYGLIRAISVDAFSNVNRVVTNPESNISNGSLGYFQVSEVQELEVIIK